MRSKFWGSEYTTRRKAPLRKSSHLEQLSRSECFWAPAFFFSRTLNVTLVFVLIREGCAIREEPLLKSLFVPQISRKVSVLVTLRRNQ